jgi:hypothetical protein
VLNTLQACLVNLVMGKGLAHFLACQAKTLSIHSLWIVYLTATGAWKSGLEDVTKMVWLLCHKVSVGNTAGDKNVDDVDSNSNKDGKDTQT